MSTSKMSKADRAAWIAKSERMNAGCEIAVGDRVQDFLLRKGVVTRVDPANPENPIEEHGTVEVLLDGGDAEHFTHSAWKRQLRRQSPDFVISKTGLGVV